MIKEYYADKKWLLWAYGGGLLLFISLYAQVYLSVQINVWYRSFYDIINEYQKHSMNEFWGSMLTFCKIAVPYVLIATITGYFSRIYALRWREALTFNYIPKWKKIHEDIEGSSQRIQQDTERFARIVESLGLKLVEAIMTLIAFIPILWGLSDGIIIPVLNTAYSGSLVYVTLIVSLGGLIVSWFVGIKLPGLEYNNQKVEAAFRKELVFGEDDKKNYCSLFTLSMLFTGVRTNYQRLFLHYGYFDIWTGLFGQIMVIVPYLILVPSLFSGIIGLGVVIQTSNAFQRVYNSLALFINNWTVVTELRSIYKRLHEFEENIKEV